MEVIAEKITEITSRGFAVIPDIITKGEAVSLRVLLQQCIDEDLAAWAGKPYQDAWMVHNLMVRGMPFAHLMTNDVLQGYLAELLDPNCIIYAYTSSSMPPRGCNYSARIHVDCPRLIPGYATNIGIMLALDDFTPDNGATYFLPGSHTRWECPSEDEFMASAERVYPKRGDAVFFNARTFHRGSTNMTAEPRHAITMNVCRSFMRQRFDYPRLVSRELAEALGEIGRRFLGFNVRMPTSLAEFYLPEDQRLYKAAQG